MATCCLYGSTKFTKATLLRTSEYRCDGNSMWDVGRGMRDGPSAAVWSSLLARARRRRLGKKGHEWLKKGGCWLAEGARGLPFKGEWDPVKGCGFHPHSKADGDAASASLYWKIHILLSEIINIFWLTCLCSSECTCTSAVVRPISLSGWGRWAISWS